MNRSRVLSQRELTVALLARQSLLERRRVPVERGVRELAAIQAQYSPSPYVALFSRLTSFETAQLEDALRAGTVVKSTLMRGTLHLVAARDYPSFAVAWQRQGAADMRGRFRGTGVDEEKLRRDLLDYVRVPRTTDEIRDRVAELSGGELRRGDLLDHARALVPMRHVFPSGAWRQHGKFSLVAWQGDAWPVEPAATALLVRRYLAAFGPATREDVAHFSYLRYRQLDPALAEIDDLRRFTDTDGRDLLDLEGAPLPAEDVPVPVRFLPKWDVAVISHRDRTRILPAALHDEVARSRNGEVRATYLVDGSVAGTWTSERTGAAAAVVLRPLVPIPPRTRPELEAEALRLSRFLEPDAAEHRLVVA